MNRRPNIWQWWRLLVLIVSCVVPLSGHAQKVLIPMDLNQSDHLPCLLQMVDLSQKAWPHTNSPAAMLVLLS